MKREIISVLLTLVLVLSFSLLPATPAMAADGSGTCNVSPTEVVAGSTNNTLTFTFTASETMDGGAITITAPADWSAPQGNSGEAGYTTVNSTGTLGKVLASLDATDNWSASTGNITLSANTTENREGNASLEATIAEPATATDKWYYDFSSSENWSSYTKVGFWIRSSVVTSSGNLTFAIAETANLGTVTDTIDIPALTAGQWAHVTLNLAVDGTTRDEVLSYGIVMANDIGAADVFLDEILIGPDDSNAISFSGQVATARILALANAEAVTVVYGDGGGASGVTAQTMAETVTFTTKSKSAADGILANLIAGSPSVTVNPGAFAGYTVVPASTSQVAGAAFTVNITAVDELQNISPSGINDATLNTYTFTFSGPANAPDSTTPTYPTTANFTSGVWAPSVTLVKAETAALVVTDNQSAEMSGTSADITVAPAEADSLGVTGITDPITRGTPSNVTVTSYDSYRNVATSYNGTVAFTSSDAAAALPSDYAFVPATDNGTRTFTNGVTFNTVGEQWVTATDNSTGTITGTRSGITVYIEYAGSGAPPTYYTSTSLFGTTGKFCIDSNGKILEKITATSEDSNLTVTIPEGTEALDEDGDPLESLEASIDESPPDPPEESHVIGLAYDFGPDGATFDPPLTLTWTYDPDALPEGVAEEDLVVAYYDEEADEWVECERTCDPETHCVTACVCHFTCFAIIGVAKPAAFTLSSLVISPTEVAPGEEVSISISVANTGGMEGSYTVVLKINNVKEAEESVTVAASSSQDVSFSVAKEEAGIYDVVVDGLSGSFTVVAPPPPAPTPPAPAPAPVVTAPETPPPAPAPPAPAPVVTAPETPPEAPAPNWPMVGGIIAATVVVIGLLIFFLVRRRGI